MKTLYVADLDGTLLTPEKVISPTTRDILNSLMDQGLNFTVATARTIATVRPLLSELRIRLPMMLMSGVSAWDPVTQHFDHVVSMPADAVEKVLALLRSRGIHCFLYTLPDDTLGIWYENLDTQASRDFVAERVKLGKRFTRTADLRALAGMSVVNVCVICYPEEMLRPVYEELLADGRYTLSFYKDVYSTENLWYLEVCAANTSKADAIRYLQEHCGCERIVCFGDNHNDLPMFEASDESCAVANAQEAVRARATRVIGPNTADGVARYLQSLPREAW